MVPSIGERENSYMKKKINLKTDKGKMKSQILKNKKQFPKVVKENSVKYTAENIGNIEIIKDFLPSPEKLVLKDSTIKITLNLSKSSVEFFKELAEKHGSQYQKVIRSLLDSYTSNYVK